jgi:hypothetical protein
LSGRPALIRQRDIKQVLGAAKKAGAKDVTFKIGAVVATINLADDDKPLVEEDEVTL